eukprot:scaffold104797_cov15-Tisochrysis_lutea.AAC.1
MHVLWPQLTHNAGRVGGACEPEHHACALATARSQCRHKCIATEQAWLCPGANRPKAAAAAVQGARPNHAAEIPKRAQSLSRAALKQQHWGQEKRGAQCTAQSAAA